MRDNNRIAYGYHANETEESYIDSRTAELLNTETYDPNLYHNITYAIGEDALAKHMIEIETAMRNRDFLTLGRLVWTDIVDYWERQADSQAADEWNHSLG